MHLVAGLAFFFKTDFFIVKVDTTVRYLSFTPELTVMDATHTIVSFMSSLLILSAVNSQSSTSIGLSPSVSIIILRVHVFFLR